jgi:hypothetical protein
MLQIIIYKGVNYYLQFNFEIICGKKDFLKRSVLQ